MSDQERAKESVETGSLPGPILKSAREEKKLSIDNIASRLMLNSDVIRALERDDYDGLPETTYIRGYLLSYCRLLGQSESILDPFDEANKTQYPLTVNNPGKRVSCSDDGWARCISIGLVALFILAIGLWVYERLTNQANESWDIFTQTLVGSKIVVVEPVNVPNAENVFVKGKEPAAGIGNTAVEPSVGGNRHRQIVGKSAALKEQNSQASSPLAELERTADLLISFTGESWIQVNDVDGERLKSGVYNSGERIMMNGESSYSIVVGRIDNVEIRFLGKYVDLKAHQRGEVARLTLDLPAE